MDARFRSDQTGEDTMADPDSSDPQADTLDPAQRVKPVPRPAPEKTRQAPSGGTTREAPPGGDTLVRPPDPPSTEDTLPPPSGSAARLEATEQLPLSGRPAPAQPAGAVPGYELLGELGRGGMGVVYKARHVALDRLVALKMILAGGHAGAQELARFRTEAHAVARLQHPNIVQIYEVGEQDGRPFFSLEFCAGGTLSSRLKGTPLPEREAAQLVALLARAMHAAHQAGVIHRDLKPANVLLADGSDKPVVECRPKIADFGLAKRLDVDRGQTATEAVLGTPSYMAPEQAEGKGKAIGPPADTYALGAMLYELLTGRPPFKGTTLLDTLEQVVTFDPVALRQLQPKTARDLETVCLKCLQKEPAKRYASAEALAEDLERFLRGEPIQARPVGAAERLAKWVRRRPALAGMTALLAVVAVAAFVLVTWQWRSAVSGWSQAQDNADAEAKAKKDAEEKKERAEKAEHVAVEKQQSLERALAGSWITQAYNAWRDNSSVLGQDLLASCPTGTSFWDWRYVKGLCAGSEFTLSGHTGPVLCVAVSPDGNTVASGSADRKVKLWDLRTGKELASFEGHAGTVNALAFSPDGKLLASGSSYQEGTQAKGDVRLWDVTTGKEVRALRGQPGSVLGLAFNSDGSRLATASAAWDEKRQQPAAGDVRLWTVADGKLATVLEHAGPARAVAFSADGTRLAAASYDRTVRLWNAGTGGEERPLRGFTLPVTSLVFSPDGKRLAAGSGGDDPERAGEVKVWDLAAGKEGPAPQGHVDIVASLAYSRDSTLLAGNSVGSFGRPGEVKVWDAATGAEVMTLKGHGSQVTGVAFTADGQRLACACSDRTVKVWDVQRGPQAQTLAGHLSRVNGLAFSLDGTRVASAGAAWDEKKQRQAGGEIRLWDTASGHEEAVLRGHTLPVTSVAFSPDGKRLVSGSGGSNSPGQIGDVVVWDLADRRAVLTLVGHRGPVTGVACSPDGKYLASSSGAWDTTKGYVGGDVKVWDAHTGAAGPLLKGHAWLATCVTFNLDGTRLASGSAVPDWDDRGRHIVCGEIKVWDVQSGQEALTLHGHGDIVLSVAFSSDGLHLASGSADGTVKVWDARSGEEVLPLKGQHTGAVTGVAFSPDGQRLASSSDDRTVKVWDVQTGQELLTLKGHTDRVAALAFSPDGTLLGSAGWDKTVKLWPVQAGRHALTLKGHTGPVLAASFRADSKRLASASRDQTVQVWDMETGRRLFPLAGHTGPVNAAAFSPDGKVLASGSDDKTIKVWDVEARKEMRTLKGHDGAVTCVAFRPDGTRLASGSADHTVRVWDPGTGQQVLTLLGPERVNQVAFSPDGQSLAVAYGAPDNPGGAGEVRVWNLESKQEVFHLTGHAGPVTCVAFSPDGTRLATGSADRTVRLWDAADGREVGLPLKGHTATVRGVAFSADGQRLASAADDWTVRVWDTQIGQQTLTFRGHAGPVYGVAFSPDGQLLASAGAGGPWDEGTKQFLSGELKIWEVPAVQRPETRAAAPK
jgi:WD40 repeat protein